MNKKSQGIHGIWAASQLDGMWGAGSEVYIWVFFLNLFLDK